MDYKAEVTGVRIVPFTTAQGKSTQMVLVDWKNTGTAPLSAVFADITAYDAGGNKLPTSTTQKCVFAVFKDDERIQPGDSYISPDGEGFILLPSPVHTSASRATATIVGASDKTDDGEHIVPVLNGLTISSKITESPTPIPRTYQVTYRISGASRGILGTYTRSPNDEVKFPISVPAEGQYPGYTLLPWETTASMNIGDKDLIFLSPYNAWSTDPPITAQILIDGKLIATATGDNPDLTVECDDTGCKEQKLEPPA